MIIFDLDNTLRLTTNDEEYTPFHRGDDPGNPLNWVDWQNYANEKGVPNDPIVKLYTTMCQDKYKTYIVTSSQYGTKEWLEKHRLPIPYSITERQPSDWSEGVDYKKQFIDRKKQQISLWVDDHTETCDYVESLGIAVLRVGI